MNNIIELPDGRNLAYVIYGPEHGKPVIYFHGTPSSRLEPTIVTTYGINLEALLIKYNLRIIAIDRPGCGLSTFNPTGNFVSFASDVQFLKKQLNIGQCKLLCWSGGGPFALAMAYTFPAETQSVYIITAFSISFSNKKVFKKMHLNKIYFSAAKYFPSITAWIMYNVLKRETKRSVPQKITGLPDVDYRLLADVDKLRHVSEATVKESSRLHSKGAVYEAGLYFQNFGFTLSDITQPVYYWWGSEDNAVIREHAEAVEREVKNSKMFYKEHEGHLSIYIHYIEEVFKVIAET